MRVRVDIILKPARETDGAILVVGLGLGDEVGGGAGAGLGPGQGALEDRGRHARAHLVAMARQREQRRAGPKHVGRRRVRVALGRVEEEVAHARARDVLMLGRDVGEEQARGHVGAGPQLGRALELGLAEVREAQQPQHGARHARQDAQPGAEGARVDLVTIGGVNVRRGIVCVRVVFGKGDFM